MNQHLDKYIDEDELNTALSSYLLITDFEPFRNNTNTRLQSLEDMFEWDDGHIRAKAGLYTDSFLSSGGKNTTDGCASDLWGLGDVNIASPADGESLVYDLASGKWVNMLVKNGLDVSDMWTALATSDSSKKINISHIPDLSDSYLPLSGGDINGNLTVTGNITTKSRLRMYKYQDDVLQGGFQAYLSPNNSLMFSYNKTSDTSILNGTHFSIVNFNGGNTELISVAEGSSRVAWMATSSSGPSTAIRVFENNVVISSSVDLTDRYLAGDLGGYCEVAGLNFAITSKETSYKDMTGVTFDWDKTEDTLKLNKIQYDESELAKKTSFVLDINGRLNVSSIGDSLTKITFSNGATIEVDGDNLKFSSGLWSDSFITAGGQGSGGSGAEGIDITAMWTALADGTPEKINISHIPTIPYSQVSGTPTLATVATSGKYSDLSGTPTIPTSLKSPYSLIFGDETYDGSAEKTITASDLGLGNVDNTKDSDKSVNYATTAGSAKASDVYAWAKAATKPTYTKSEVGLGNVDNLAASGYLTVLSSSTTNAVSITVGGTTKSITAATLKTSLGLKALAYQDSITTTDVAEGNNLYFTNERAIDACDGTYLKLSGGTLEGPLTVKGNISASGAITAGTASDIRLKDNIQSITENRALEVLMSLNPITFTWNDKANELGRYQGLSQGFIAQEYEKLIPNSGRAIWEKYRAINYNMAIPYLTKGWQIHETRIERLERENKELKQELQTLKQQYYGI